jgi:hypothetical protein
MSSTRFILIFLGFIFIIIVILSSQKIAGGLRERFGGIIPFPKATNEEVTPTPSASGFEEETTPTPTLILGSSTPSGEIPATGPAEVAYFILGGSLFLGALLRKTTDSSPKSP